LVLYQIYNKEYEFLSSMARLVRKEDRGPIEVKVGNASKWICMCGLSSNQPFCDGSHKKTADEEAGKVYRYNTDGTRNEIQ
jgi:CDGSH iron-sulfur domain-containing protein 3